MGTRGWFVFMHKGVYYRFYNNSDSYFTALGRSLISILARGGEDLLADLRTFFDLTAVVDRYKLEPLNEKVRALWESKRSSVEEFPIDRGELVVQDHEETFLTGDGCFIEYIYLIDLDTKRFHASNVINSRVIFVYDINEDLHPGFMELAKDQKLPVAASWNQMFPIPKVHFDAVKQGIEENGYDLVSPQPVSLGMHAFIFELRHKNSHKKAFAKIFYKFTKHVGGSCGGFREMGEYKRSMAVADMLMKQTHPQLVEILLKTEIGGFPTLFLRAYDGCLDEVLEDFQPKAPAQTSVLYSHALGDVILGVTFLMEKGIVHHDIKPENVLVNIQVEKGKEDIHAVVCDFESIGIPWESHENGLLDWGPFNNQGVKEGQSKRDGLWLKGWDPYKWTDRYCHPKRKQVNPWHLDSYSISMIVDTRLRSYAESFADETRKHRLEALCDEVVRILQSAPESKNEVKENLVKASELLKGYQV